MMFFDRDAACELTAGGKRADLIIANNVLAHVPALNNFIAGLKLLLAENGVVTLEFPHLLQLMDQNQFDTIYHEHIYYFSLTSVSRAFAPHELQVFDVQELPTHGGSLRIYVSHTGCQQRQVSGRVAQLLSREEAQGFTTLDHYTSFQGQVAEAKRSLLRFLVDAKDHGNAIAGYGAPAKGNTLLNYCGIGKDFIDYTVDRSPHKQGLFLPGTHIPIYSPETLKETRPDYLLILPWNLKDEVMDQMECIRDWGGQFLVPIPTVRLFQ